MAVVDSTKTKKTLFINLKSYIMTVTYSTKISKGLRLTWNYLKATRERFRGDRTGNGRIKINAAFLSFRAACERDGKDYLKVNDELNETVS